jgi:hypothetical protein
MFDSKMKQTNMKSMTGIKFQMKQVQFGILKAALKAPINIRKILPGPKMEPTIISI